MDSRFLKALAEPVRVELVKRLLVDGPSDIGALAEGMPQHRSVISRHLSILLESEIVQLERDGRHRIYRLSASTIITNLETMLTQIRQLVTMCCPEELTSS